MNLQKPFRSGAWIREGNNWCSPYTGWQKIYEYSPLKVLSEQHNVVWHILKDTFSSESAEDYVMKYRHLVSGKIR